MKNKKGFTLVELLAVIVILAVLVLIAVPSVIKMLDNTKKNAFAVEAENIIKAGKNAYASEMLDGTFESGCYSLEKLGQYTDKNFDGYSGSVYIDTDTNTFKVWLSKDDYIVNGSTSGNIEVVELSQVQPASTTCEDIEIIACSDTPSTYTLAIDPNGGVHEGKTTVETYEIERKGVKAINDPYKVGYAFDGWETIAGSVTSFTSRLLTMSNTNVEIRAKWKTLYTYTGASSLIDDGDGNWRIRLLTDGTLIFNEDPGPIDIFLVGGGGSGNSGGGGGGGYTRTVPSYVVTKNREYEIDIGAGGFGGSGGVGGNAGLPTIAFEFTVDGGAGASPNAVGDVAGGGAGGSGGAGHYARGGSDGSNGFRLNTSYSRPGTGQGPTTREFGEASGDLYAGGGGSHLAGGDGGGGSGGLAGVSGAGQPNTGGGGGGNSAGNNSTLRTFGSGGSGIVIIRNHRSNN